MSQLDEIVDAYSYVIRMNNDEIVAKHSEGYPLKGPEGPPVYFMSSPRNQGKSHFERLFNQGDAWIMDAEAHSILSQLQRQQANAGSMQNLGMSALGGLGHLMGAPVYRPSWMYDIETRMT